MVYIQTARTIVNKSALVAVRDKTLFCSSESLTNGFEWKTEKATLPMIQNLESSSQIQYTPSLNDRELTVSALIVTYRIAVSRIYVA